MTYIILFNGQRQPARDGTTRLLRLPAGASSLCHTPGKTPATGYPLRSIKPLNGMHSVSKRNATGYRMQNDGYPNTDDSISGIVKQENIPESIRRISKNKELSPSGNYHTHLSENTFHRSGNMIFNLQDKLRRLISQATCTGYFPEPHRIVFRQWRQIAS